MQRYIGTKLLNGEPMSLGEYNKLRGWLLPENEDGSNEGYLVEYLDGGEPNHEDFDNYISWSPKEQFENAYRKTDGLNFGLAIEAMKKGYKAARVGWNGKGMFLILVDGTENAELRKETPYHSALNTETQAQPTVTINPHIDMFTATGEMQPGWLCSQTDMLADDWVILE